MTRTQFEIYFENTHYCRHYHKCDHAKKKRGKIDLAGMGREERQSKKKSGHRRKVEWVEEAQWQIRPLRETARELDDAVGHVRCEV